MNIQEMATAAENQLDVKIILMNNEALGLVYQQQSLFYQQGVFAATYPGMINLCRSPPDLSANLRFKSRSRPAGGAAGDHRSSRSGADSCAY